MKILHVSYHGGGGGAGIAMLRLNDALNRAGHESSYLCVRNVSQRSDGREALEKIRFFVNRLVNSLMFRFLKLLRLDVYKGNQSYNFVPTGLHKTINESDADIIHFHWINAEMMSVEEVRRIKKPIVWTLHDMWAFCGSDHYPEKTWYEDGFGQAESFTLKSDALLYRLDRWVWERKRKNWAEVKFWTICPSRWLADCASKSLLFKNQHVDVIHNCLNLEIFLPREQTEARRSFGLPANKKIILFGAYSPSDQRKGGDLLEMALRHIRSKNVLLVIFGAEGEERIAGLPTIWLGKIFGDEMLSNLYNTADVFVAPSRQDNLPNTCVEAQACGTPVVGFDIGGISDIVEHDKTGSLAKAFDAEDLAGGIDRCLNAGGMDRNYIRKRAEDLFSEKRVSDKYTAAYRECLKRGTL